MTEDNNFIDKENIDNPSKRKTFKHYFVILIQSILFAILYLFLAAFMIGLPLYLIFGLDWIFSYGYLVVIACGFPFLIFTLWLWNRVIKKRKLKELDPVWKLFIEFFILMSYVVAINILIGLFLGIMIFLVIFYPCVFLGFYIWIKKVKKKDLKEFTLGKPNYPQENNPGYYNVLIFGWVFLSIVILIVLLGAPFILFYYQNTPDLPIIIFFYFAVFVTADLGGLFVWIKLTKREVKNDWLDYFLIVGWISIMGTFIIIVIFTDLVSFRPPELSFYIIFGFIYTCVYAPVFEEIIFRGYLYSQAEEIYGESKIQFNISSEKYDYEGEVIKKPIVAIEITYVAIVSSLCFGLWHMDPLNSIRTFISGLVYCKLRKDTDSLIPSIIWHSIWNFTVTVLMFFYIPV